MLHCVGSKNSVRWNGHRFCACHFCICRFRGRGEEKGSTSTFLQHVFLRHAICCVFLYCTYSWLNSFFRLRHKVQFVKRTNGILQEKTQQQLRHTAEQVRKRTVRTGFVRMLCMCVQFDFEKLLQDLLRENLRYKQQKSTKSSLVGLRKSIEWQKKDSEVVENHGESQIQEPVSSEDVLGTKTLVVVAHRRRYSVILCWN